MKVYSLKVWKYLSRISLPFPVCGTANMDLKLQPWADIIPITGCWIGLLLSHFYGPARPSCVQNPWRPSPALILTPIHRPPPLGLSWSMSQRVTYAQSWGGNYASAPQLPCTWLSSPVLKDPDCLVQLLVQQAKYTVYLALNHESLQPKGILLKSTAQLK